MANLTIEIPSNVYEFAKEHDLVDDITIVLNGTANGKSGVLAIENTSGSPYTVSLPVGHYVEENLSSSFTLNDGEIVELNWITGINYTKWVYVFFAEIV